MEQIRGCELSLMPVNSGFTVKDWTMQLLKKKIRQRRKIGPLKRRIRPPKRWIGSPRRRV
jgi:hypothetical protein